MKIVKVNNLPKWLYKGVGVNGGGDYIGKQEVNEKEVDLIMCWEGINGTRLYPAYFKQDDQWYRILWKDISLMR